MKRKTFIMTAVAVATVAAVPVIKYKCHNGLPGDPLVRPDVLAHFCDIDTIREIGIYYRSKFPDENNKEILAELLLTSDAGKKITFITNSEEKDWLDQKTQQEFKTGRIVIIDGWILSQTEARQCALLSFNNN